MTTAGARFSPRAPRTASRRLELPQVPHSRTPSSTPRSTVRRPLAIVAAPPAVDPRIPIPPTGRKQVPVGAFALALVLIGIYAVGLGVGQATGGFTLPDLFAADDAPPPREFPVLEPSRPTRITIPALKVDAPVHSVGLADDGTVEVPTLERHTEAGWFDRGPTPGQYGPAVLVGHADTRTGPSVFHGLRTLRPGARIEIVRRDREVAIFEVNSVEYFGKSELPTARVHGDFSRPGLRLVTCGGRWLGGSTGYSDNLVVFASLIGSRQEK